jgi:hypothetical protein
MTWTTVDAQQHDAVEGELPLPEPKLPCGPEAFKQIQPCNFSIGNTVAGFKLQMSLFELTSAGLMPRGNLTFLLHCSTWYYALKIEQK